MYASHRSTLKVFPPLFMTRRINLRHFGWIDYATFVMRRRRHPDWKCKGNRNVTREPEKGFSRPALSLSLSLPDCRNEKSSLMNLSTFLYTFLSFPIDVLFFIFFVQRQEIDDDFPLQPILQAGPPKNALQCWNFWGKKYGHTKEK